jgi:hypothetical protein
MKVIFKYPIKVRGWQCEIEIPKGARNLTVQLDQKTNTPCLWAMVDPHQPKEKRIFQLILTGEIINDGNEVYTYLGTCQESNGQFIYHVFEVLK